MFIPESKIIRKDYLHCPTHVFIPNVSYIVTAATHKKELYFSDEESLDYVQKTLFLCAEQFKWELQAWAIMKNHYHFVAQASDNPKNLVKFIQRFHSITARYINLKENYKDRKVWYQYWDTCLTDDKSYYPRLNYVHNNPVKHKLVERAEDYPWCSMRWFINNAKQTEQKKIFSFKYDKIKINDDF